MRKEILDRIYYPHLRIEKSKSRARQSVFWPLMNKEIKDRVAGCPTCTDLTRNNRGSY